MVPLGRVMQDREERKLEYVRIVVWQAQQVVPHARALTQMPHASTFELQHEFHASSHDVFSPGLARPLGDNEYGESAERTVMKVDGSVQDAEHGESEPDVSQ